VLVLAARNNPHEFRKTGTSHSASKSYQQRNKSVTIARDNAARKRESTATNERRTDEADGPDHTTK
jgi:hypothetical protein